VRPSSAAATSDGLSALDHLTARKDSGISAAQDGHTPLKTYGGRTTLLLLSAVLLFSNSALCQNLPGEPLRFAEQVRRLTPQEAERHLPVRLEAVVTFYDEELFSRFVQDATAGIYLREMTNMPPLVPGQLVQVEGETSAGEYAPIVVPKSVTIIKQGDMPTARSVSLEDLVSGREDSQFIEVSGTVRSVRFEEESHNSLIDLAIGGERFTAYSRQLPVADSERLVESIIKVRAVCSTLFNRQRQLFGVRLLVPRPADLLIEKPAPANPFDIPSQQISSLLRFTSEGTFGHRVKVSGVVVYYELGSALFIQDEQEGLYCLTRKRLPLLQEGDRVEVIGFPAKGEYNPVLQDSDYRKMGAGPPPPSGEIGLDAALAGSNDCQLVRMDGKLLEQAQRGREQFLVLEKDGYIFDAYLAQEGKSFGRLLNGSRVSVTGICLIERGSSWRAGESWRAKSFRILLRTPQDVVLLRAPPWWTLRKLLWIAGSLGLVTLAAFGWVGVLRRRVQHQTAIIAQKLRIEAALKERYQDLFENANDMVFTHDLEGRITSVNQTGERLLHYQREKLLSRNLVELVAEDQRSAASQWLKQVASGVESPTAEWNFVNAAGQQVKLEISSRLVQQDGRAAEVEAIARDITERRRLESEILEISNREQRRIGHDLHDGVCQQLAAVNYLADMLGDQLRDKRVPEAAEAERIANLINEANTQARNVARGLFPARLEEHGLALALEELATSAGARYRISCHFVCQVAPPKLDSQSELHLYYIAQEALINAIKHGKATTVIITLAAEGDRLKLAIQDNGTGFQTLDKNRSGMGIRIMRYRAQVIGATLDLRSKPNSGTEVTCLFHPTHG
jgi:PAS domain S-box-containing protein